MKKLNFNNKDWEDDKNLIETLKTSTTKETSDQFVDDTMKRFLALKTIHKITYKPLRLPIYFMTALGIFLVVPLISKVDIQNTFSSPIPKAIEYLEMAFVNLSLWYAMSLLLLLIVGQIVIRTQTGINENGEPII